MNLSIIVVLSLVCSEGITSGVASEMNSLSPSGNETLISPVGARPLFVKMTGYNLETPFVAVVVMLFVLATNLALCTRV